VHLNDVTRAWPLLLLLLGACAPTSRVSSYHQRCLECALRRSADPTGIEQARIYFSEGCVDGDVPSCSVLGVMYEHGRGVAADTTRAMALYRYACMRGNAGSCVNLGRLMEAGRGDVAGAAAAYEVACATKHAEGCQRLAGVQRSLEETAVYGE
jgi:TPR repeat protein